MLYLSLWILVSLMFWDPCRNSVGVNEHAVTGERNRATHDTIPLYTPPSLPFSCRLRGVLKQLPWKKYVVFIVAHVTVLGFFWIVVNSCPHVTATLQQKANERDLVLETERYLIGWTKWILSCLILRKHRKDATRLNMPSLLLVQNVVSNVHFA